MTPVERRHARLARVLMVRQRVAAVAIALFIAAFATVYVQMATGRDPALGASAVTQTTAAASDSVSTDTSTDDTSSDASSSSDDSFGTSVSDDTSSDDTSPDAPAASSVTTSQS